MAPARSFLTVYSETPLPKRVPNSGDALSLDTSSQFGQDAGGPTATATSPAQYLFAIYAKTP
eukprot:5090198-Pyramimonas_sp.AAC.1